MRVLDRGRLQAARAGNPLRGLSYAGAALLFALAIRVFLGRFDRLVSDATIFTGVTYTDDHITLAGLLIVALALAAGGVIALANAIIGPRVRWLVASVVPAAVCYVLVSLVGWYVNSFIVKPNELVRERPYISHNIEMTRQAYGLDRITLRPFPAESGLDAIDADANRATLENLRLWDWRALQDTLRQIQEIRTYYDFPDIDIDRYNLGGTVRQVMLGTRELSIEKLPQSSRNWINEKLIYTHGYGVTMNPSNGFTPEGLPTLLHGQHARPEHAAGADRHAAGNLLRRAHQHRRLRQDAPEGIQLPAGRDQQPHLVRGRRRHRRRRIPAALLHRARARRRRQASVQRRCPGRQPAADAAQPPRTCLDAGAIPHLRSRSLHRRRRRRAAVVDDGRVHHLGQLPLLAPLPARTDRGELHPEQRQGGRQRVRRIHVVLRLRQGRSDDRGLSDDLSDALQGCVGHAAPIFAGTCVIPSCCSSCRPPSTACIT